MNVPVIVTARQTNTRTDQTRTLVFRMWRFIMWSPAPGIWKECIAFILQCQVNQFSVIHLALRNEGNISFKILGSTRQFWEALARWCMSHPRRPPQSSITTLSQPQNTYRPELWHM